MAKPKKKKRTSIRTAAGTAQDRFRARLEELAADPLRVLPEMPVGEPKPLRKIRVGLEKIAAGKVGFAAKRDKGIVGAVAQSIPLLEQPAFPRLADHKVGGRRRFYLMRGQVQRGCMLGVQNHDDAQTLLMAYRPMAKAHGLHFFCDSKLSCSGTQPVPPERWWDFLAAKAELTWQHNGATTCSHPNRDLVELTLPDGPSIAVCGDCTKTVGSLHALLKAHHVGPKERQPYAVQLRRGGIDGEAVEVPRELLAEYRGGIVTDAALLSRAAAEA